MFAVGGKPYRGRPAEGKVLSHVNDRSVRQRSRRMSNTVRILLSCRDTPKYRCEALPPALPWEERTLQPGDKTGADDVGGT